MAASYVCDGCGQNVEKPKVVGYVIRRDYCPKCAENAEAFLKTEEAERNAFAVRFAEVRQLLIGVHGQNGFKLPDVP